MKFNRFLTGIIFLLSLAVSNSAFAQYSYTGFDVYPAFPSGSTHNMVLLIDSTRNYTISENTTLNTLEVKVTDASFNTLHTVNLPAPGSGGQFKIQDVRPDKTLYLCYTTTGSFLGDSLHLVRIDTTAGILMHTSFLSVVGMGTGGYALTNQGDLLYLRTQFQDPTPKLLHFDSNGNFISDNYLEFFVNNPSLAYTNQHPSLNLDNLGFLYVKVDSMGEWQPFSVNEYRISRYLVKSGMDGSFIWQKEIPYNPTATDATYFDGNNLVVMNDTILMLGETVYDTYADDGISAKIQPTILFYDTSGTLLSTYVSQDSIIGDSNMPPNYTDYPLRYIGKSPTGDLILTQQFVLNGTPIATNPKVIAINPQTMNLSYDFDLLPLYDPSLTYLDLDYSPNLIIFNYPPGELSCFAYYQIHPNNTFSEEFVQFRLDASGNILFADTSMGMTPFHDDFTHLSQANGNMKLVWVFQTGSTLYPANYRWCYNCSETVTGRLYNDILSDCADASDPAFPAHLLSFDNGTHYQFTDGSGNYLAYLDSGPHTIEPVVYNFPFWYSPCVNLPLIVNAPNSPNVSSGNDMPLSFLPNVHEIKAYATIVGTRPGYSNGTCAMVENNGTVPETGVLEYFYTDSIFDYLSAVPAPDSISAGYLAWNYYNLQPFNNLTATIHFFIPATVPLGQPFELKSIAGNINIDTFPLNNTSTYYGIVNGSWDPNDKQVWPKGTGPEGYITPQDSLMEYLIRFQNTGTDTALIVRIEDMIDEDLDLATLQIGIASHPYTVQLNGRKLIFTFDNIMLPDSGANFSASNGLIQYFIEQKPGLPIGTEIKNVAAIYFDFNAPVITNMVTNTIDWATEVEELITNLNGNKLIVYPNPFGENIELLWNINPEESVISSTLYSIQGQMLADLSSIFKTHSGKTDISWATSALPPGIYILKTTFTSENQILRIIKF